jgi:hypothetical protein
MELSAQLVAPESIIWNEFTDSYIISDAGSGKLWKMDKSGNLTQFTSGLNSPKGMAFSTLSLWVTDVNKIIEIDPFSGIKLNEYPIPGAGQLNDITTDDFMSLFISDMQNNKIFIFDLFSFTSQQFSVGIILQPNGIVYDLIGGLIVVSFVQNNAKIYTVDEEEGNVSELMTTNLGQLDGIAYDTKRNRYYVSSWKTNSIYIFDPAFMDAPELLQSGLNGPADIYYNEDDDILAVPVMNESRIEFIKLGGEITLDAPELLSPLNNASNLSQNVTFTWNTVQNASSYIIQIATASDFNSTDMVYQGQSDNQDSHIIKLNTGTTYFWHIKAIAGKIESDWSETRTFSTLVISPANLLPANNSILKKPIEFTWTYTETNGISYNFILGANESFNEVISDTTLITKTFTIEDLEYYTDYYWKVRAIKNDIYSEWSGTNKFSIILNTPKLSIPANGSVEMKAPVEFEWNTVNDAEFYRFEISESNNFSTALLDTVLQLTSLTYSNFKYETKYYWHVKAGISANETNWSEIFSFTTESDPISVNDFSEKENILIYPNPVSDILYIENRFISATPYKIYNILGILVVEGMMNNLESSQKINIPNLTNGIYIIEIKTENKLFTNMFIKH